jgi:hypothetical protein
MDRLRDKIFYAAVSVSSGFAGLVFFARCAGTPCTACFGCGGIGFGILLIILSNKIKGIKRGLK